jgi:EAL domain-containing protein (putative c-di-GMP-specific phosphodiesterase class I)
VSVNVTPRDIADPSLVVRVEELLASTGTPPDALVLELTESDAMKDPERTLHVLTELRALGVQVSIDDFGTGYSSLAYIDQMPVSEVKIDQSFVFRLERDAGDAAIVRATVGLAHDLGLRVVAEGVENALARSLVAQLGADLYQGYGLARPMPAGEVLGWLAKHAAATSRERADVVAFSAP